MAPGDSIAGRGGPWLNWNAAKPGADATYCVVVVVNNVVLPRKVRKKMLG